ncbi:MAG: hypothetical protein A2X94_09190 [Bdellovibrionales bacterium GWB1_55_8]|nr:MAG: hypothetical protein A2X94_09190 [Bdellovibrionales bacterium GWB1_55_8]
MADHLVNDLKEIRLVLFDWGDTLMRDYGVFGQMAAWEKVHVFEDVAETLDYLAKKYTLGIATNALESNSEAVHRALNRGLIGQYFKTEHIFSAADIPWSKPRPEFYHHILKTLSLSEAQVCMVGDSFTNDVEGSSRLGIASVWLNRGGSEVRRGPGYSTIFSLDQLKKLL